MLCCVDAAGNLKPLQRQSSCAAACTPHIFYSSPEHITHGIADYVMTWENLTCGQGCLGSDLEEEAALALEALALLVERDGLKFQKAWAAVQRRAPTLPDQAWVAAAWLALLGHAHRDAEKHPEQFAGFHDTLWQATEHPSARVFPGLSPCACGSSSNYHAPLIVEGAYLKRTSARNYASGLP